MCTAVSPFTYHLFSHLHLSYVFEILSYDYLGGYFPKAYDDEVNVWEDESISFYPLENDYVAGDNASLVGFSQVSISFYVLADCDILLSFDLNCCCLDIISQIMVLF